MTPNELTMEVDILSRVVGPENPSFTADVARSVLELRFGDADNDRMNDLAEKARRDSLSQEETSQLHGYLFVGAMMDLMHSKARLSLKQSGSTGND